MRLYRKLRNFQIYRHGKGLLLSRSNKSITGYKTADEALETVTGGKIFKWLDAYENVVGLTEVKKAQSFVTEAETEYRLIQERRRATQQTLTAVQGKIKVVAQDIEKAQRGTDAYIELVTKENEIIKQEKQILDNLNELDELEKHHFGLLSSAVRESHEKERARAERVKYWGLSASVIGAFLGILGTTVNNYLRMKELRKIVSSSSEQTLELYKTVNDQYTELRNSLSNVGTQLGATSDSENKGSKVSEIVSHQKDITDLIKLIQKQDKELKEGIKSIQALVSRKNSVVREDGKEMLVDSDLETMFSDSEKRLEWKMKIQSIATVTLIYAIGAVTLPILYHFLSGGS